MVKVSSRVDYALSCAIRVAEKFGSKTPVTVGQIADKEKMSVDYAEQLLVLMKRAGILRSVRGKRGGYLLAASPDKISAKDIILAIDKNILEPICFRKKGRLKQCSHFYDCKIRKFWVELKDRMECFMDGYTLEKLRNLRKKERRN